MMYSGKLILKNIYKYSDRKSAYLYKQTDMWILTDIFSEISMYTCVFFKKIETKAFSNDAMHIFRSHIV